MTSLVERLRAIQIVDIGDDYLANPDGPEAADTIEALCEALEAITNVRVDKHADNIWTGSNKCAAIARAALAKVQS